ncbi:hypothetical protein ACVWZK_001599 [Bradyrhizobium sp. GM0.4]
MTEPTMDNFTRYAATLMMKYYGESLKVRNKHCLVAPIPNDGNVYSIKLTDVIEVVYAVDVADHPELYHEPYADDRGRQFGDEALGELRRSSLSRLARSILEDRDSRQAKRIKRSGNRGKHPFPIHEISSGKQRLLRALEGLARIPKTMRKAAIPRFAKHHDIKSEILKNAFNGKNGHADLIFGTRATLKSMIKK